MKRLPIRLRLTLAFALVMAVVLTAIGLFGYLRFRSDLDRTINQGLSTRAENLAAALSQAGGATGTRGLLPQEEEGFAQVLTPRGRVLASTPTVGGASLLAGPQLATAMGDELIVDIPPVRRLEEPARLLATPARVDGRGLLVVVGTAVDDRDDSLSSLRSILLVGGPVALLLASLACYGVATRALRPVDQMRRRAAEISANEPGVRLPVPQSRDEVARLGETLNEMLERLEGAFRRERTFVSDASHELRTPLAILKTELELAMRGSRSPEELAAAIRSASEETERLARLADDLLVVARADQGPLPVQLALVNVGDLLEGMRGRFADRCAAQGRAIAVEAPRDLEIRADSLRLEQAVANLVENALSHGAGAIGLTASRTEGGAEIHVTDEGDGFPEGFVGSAFERFTRADPARARGGSGLGLAIVAAVADAHGGGAHAANRAGGGADVWIDLPAAGAGGRDPT